MYITIGQALKKYKISQPTLRKYINQWSIPTKKNWKIVLIDADDLDDYMKDIARVWVYTRATLFDEHWKPIDEKKEIQEHIQKEIENKQSEIVARDDKIFVLHNQIHRLQEESYIEKNKGYQWKLKAYIFLILWIVFALITGGLVYYIFIW